MPASTEPRGREWVALVLAIGISMAVILITAASMYDAVRSDTPGLSENATQVLTAAFSGGFGVLGSYVGYRAGRSDADRHAEGGPGVITPGPPD